MSIEPLLLSVTPIGTYSAGTLLTRATGFFFQRDSKLFLVTSEHVFRDEKAAHFPDRLQVTLHVDPKNVTQSVEYSIPLHRDQTPLWIAGADSSGAVDIAVIEIDKNALPESAVYAAFSPSNLLGVDKMIEIGTSMLIVGFPLGFHDTFHKLPVVRHAINASSFAMRFQGYGYFLTEARTHGGTSGAPVVARDISSPNKDLPWTLLGVHSARFDVSNRGLMDEALGLNCAWFADILLTLTEPRS